MRHMLPLIIVTLVVCAATAEAQQQAKKVHRIGFLAAASSSAISTHAEAFQQGMRELGYGEGKNIVIEWRFAEGKFDRLPALAAELVRAKVDLIVALSTVAARAAREATSTVPIVATSGDYLGTGLVVSLAAPGGHVTGLSLFSPDLSTKRLDLIKEVLPRVSRLAVLWNPKGPAPSVTFKETVAVAEKLGLKIQSLEVTSPDDFIGAFKAAKSGRAGAMLMIQDPMTSSNRQGIVDLATKNRLPGIYPHREFAEAGGLMAYGVDLYDVHRRLAYFVDKILKGTKPAGLAVEHPTKFELVINLRTAKQIGITIPADVLMRADKVIR